MYSLNLEEFMSPAVVWISHAFFWITAIMVIAVVAALFTQDQIDDSKTKITGVITCFACVSIVIWCVVLCVTATEKTAQRKSNRKHISVNRHY